MTPRRINSAQAGAIWSTPQPVSPVGGTSRRRHWTAVSCGPLPALSRPSYQPAMSDHDGPGAAVLTAASLDPPSVSGCSPLLGCGFDAPRRPTYDRSPAWDRPSGHCLDVSIDPG